MSGKEEWLRLCRVRLLEGKEAWGAATTSQFTPNSLSPNFSGNGKSLRPLGGEVRATGDARWAGSPREARAGPGALTSRGGSAAAGVQWGFYGLAAGAQRPLRELVGSGRGGQSEAPPRAACRGTKRLGRGGGWGVGEGEGAAEQGQGAREAEDADKRSQACQTPGLHLCSHPGTVGLSPKTGAHAGRRGWSLCDVGPLRLAALLGVSPAQGSLIGREGSRVCRGGQVGEVAPPDGALKPLATTLTAATGGRLGATRQEEKAECREGAVAEIGQRRGVDPGALGRWGGERREGGSSAVCVRRSPNPRPPHSVSWTKSQTRLTTLRGQKTGPEKWCDLL